MKFVLAAAMLAVRHAVAPARPRTFLRRLPAALLAAMPASGPGGTSRSGATFTATADSTGLIKETDEKNNTRSFTVVKCWRGG